MTRIWIWITVVGFGLVLAAQVSAAETADTPVLKTGKDKESYAVGVDLARNLKRQGVTTADAEMLAKGVRDELSGAKLLMSEEEMRTSLKAFEAELKQGRARPIGKPAEENQKQGEEFLAANKAQEGVVALPSGLQYKIIKEGNGKKPTDEDTVELNFQGSHIDGTVFAGTNIGGKPVTFKVSETIPGWREALKLMPAGSKWQLFIPPQLAYGEKGQGRYVGPNTTLIYELELLDIK